MLDWSHKFGDSQPPPVPDPDEHLHAAIHKTFMLATRRGVDGVVGYHFCLTHRRSSVRTWVDSFFSVPFFHR